jgi:hypothetical protein
MDILKESPERSDDADRTDGEMLELSGGYTVEEERAVLRKIDMVILPFVSDICRCSNMNLSWLTLCALRCVSSFSCNISTSRASAMLVYSVSSKISI